ncbi:hypothetical protein [Actinoplanes xinjiangensis]|uniref:hypothetical protein n=1 Tax=Actinoplanes xinjiangensis TaxID=512350 RepID=UPI0034368F3A
MTTTLTPTTPPRIAGRPATVLTLARAESWRLLRHPVLLVALLLSVAPWVYELVSGGLATRYPVLHDEDRFVQLPMLLLAAGALLAVNLAALRAQRDNMEAFYAVQMTTAAQRTVAHLLSAIAPAVLAAVVVTLRLIWLAAVPGAVGRVSVPEAVTAPLVVLLAGVVGLLLARLTTAQVAAPLAIVALAMLALFSAVGPRWSRWLGPIAFEDELTGSLPPDLMHRPVVWHLLYLSALLVTLALLAVGLSGARWRTTGPAAVLAAVAVAVTGVPQMAAEPADVVAARAAAATRPAGGQECREIDGIRFCAFPPYEPRAAQWADVTRGILRWAPAEVAGSAYTVRQRVFFNSSGDLNDPVPVADWQADDAAAGTPDSVPVSTSWGDRDGYNELQMFQFSGAFAIRAVTGSTTAVYDNAPICGARGLLILWLGAQATPETRKAYEHSLDNSYGGSVVLAVLTSASGPSLPRETADLARKLLDRPAAEVGEQMRQNWAKLADPATGLDEAAQLFGLRAPDGSLC